MEYLKGKLQILWYVTQLRFIYIINATVFLVSTCINFIEGFILNSIYSFISLFSILISFFLLIVDAINIWRRKMDYLFIGPNYKTLGKVKIDNKNKVLINSGYFIDKIEDHYYVCYSKMINKLLPNAKDLTFCIDKNTFKIPKELKEIMVYLLTDFSKSKIIFNSKKVRLASELTFQILSGQNMCVKLEQTDYFSSFCTNEITGYKICYGNEKRVLYDGFSLFIDKKNYLKTLEESDCSNHIGIATLAFTRDKKMIITIQSLKSAQNACKLAPSGSGSADVKDLLKSNNNFYNFIVNSMQRELMEECGIRYSKKEKELMKTIIIGYCRLLNRGGKPEFFGITYLDYDSRHLRIRTQEKKYISYIKKDIKINDTSISDFIKCLDEFIKENSTSFSVQLHIHFKFLKEFITNYPELFLNFIQGKYK